MAKIITTCNGKVILELSMEEVGLVSFAFDYWRVHDNDTWSEGLDRRGTLGRTLREARKTLFNEWINASERRLQKTG